MALLLLMAGCSEDEGAALDPDALRGEPWVLTSGLDVDGWKASAPSARFGDVLSGSSGCNQYTAAYTLDGDRMRLELESVSRMACEPPASTVERDYLAAIERVAGWRVDDGTLVLLDGDDDELLRFEVASPVGRWEVTGVRLPDSVSSPLPETTLTATFDADGKLSGDAGCNPYTTTYRAQRGTIEIAEPAGGRMMCETPEGVMEQERAYLAALPTAATYTVDGSNLSLLTADDTIAATLTRVPDQNDQKTGTSSTATTPKSASIGRPSFQ